MEVLNLNSQVSYNYVISFGTVNCLILFDCDLLFFLCANFDFIV